MAKEVRLERPDLFDIRTNLFGRRLRRILLKRGKEAQPGLDYQPNITVLIRTKNDKAGLARILNHIKHQRKTYAGRIDLIVVDTESIDGTVELAKKTGATVVKILQKDFTYPKSLNMGLAKAKPDCVAAFLSVGHAQPALNICLPAAARHFKDPNIVGVYGPTLPNQNASLWEQLMVGLVAIFITRYTKPAHKMAKPHPGIMQAAGGMYRLETWRAHPFDEAYAHGGEDSAWAKWALKQDFGIVCDLAMSVHHSHGLGLVKLLTQIKNWMYMYKNPGEFNHQKLAKFRPDLFEE